MKINKKLVILIFAIAVFVSVVMAVTASKGNTPIADIDKNSLPITLIRGSFVCDINNVQEMVGLADYVFVATVIHDNGTHYDDILTTVDENGKPIDVGFPYTDYTVQIVENIKGNLITESPIEIVKEGGIAQNQKTLYVFEQDVMPSEEETYIFLAYAQEDGSLLISGSNSNILLNSTEDIEATSEYITYKNACENEIVPFERVRSRSIYQQ